ncbi:hypothetical protein QBC34DRAFT_460256 [Podospora aff. communis PSN243]|uniref:Uncharacterized protein n=1 Tax=Podospora aff. communis PSN243 TaxID=3040156 RepID=A0AAV9H5X5_9PEZI|nr:hypothetical protein QBC34DRAFT_460256 [Podospora aff. communis PSN243]
MEQRSALWDPHVVLGLRAAGASATEILCVGTTSASDVQSSCRCSRVLSLSDTDTANRLLAEMVLQMPDQVDHNTLLQLAEACLCPTDPNPHRGSQEAAVIYRWTEMLSAEACVLRAPTSPLTPRPWRAKKMPKARVTTDLTIHIDPPKTSVRFPTPTPMTPEELDGFVRASKPATTSSGQKGPSPIDTTVVVTATRHGHPELPLTPPDSANSVKTHIFLNGASDCQRSPLSFSPASSHSGSEIAKLLAESQAQTRELVKEVSALRGEVAGCREEMQRLRGELVTFNGHSDGYKVAGRKRRHE